jgi:hypothetical protein
VGTPLTTDSTLYTSDSTFLTADMTEVMDAMDPSDEILTLMYGRLSLSYDSKNYNVYTVVPKKVPFDYVLMAPPEIVNDDDKDSNAYEVTQLFDIVTNGGERGSWKAASSLASQIMKAIMKKDITTANFQATVKPIVDSTNNFVEETEVGIIVRKLIRFRYNLQQI